MRSAVGPDCSLLAAVVSGQRDYEVDVDDDDGGGDGDDADAVLVVANSAVVAGRV